MDSKPTAFDSDAPLGDRRAIIRRNPEDLQEVEMLEAVWGSNPQFGGGASFRFVRSEGQRFPSQRCLIAASEFHMAVGPKRFRVTLDSGNFFYLAALWEPPMGEWPLSYRVLTVVANAEVAPYQQRHGAIIQRRQVMDWLDLKIPEEELLLTPPPHTFHVQDMHAAPVQSAMSL